MDKNYLIVDLGTGNTRVGLVSSSGEILCIKSFENNYYRDYEYEDAQYFLPIDWSKQILNCIKEIINEFSGEKISAITSVGARQSIVLYNKCGEAFYGLPNIDNRGEIWIKDVGNSADVYKKSGRWLTCDFPAAKLLGLKKKHIEIYNKIYKFTSLSEWIGEMFTGKICIEPSQACETQLFDIDKLDWSLALCDYFGVDKSILPDIKLAGENLGNISKEMCKELGIDEDCIFIVGGADTQVAVKGINIREGEMAIVSGTTSPIVAISNDRIYDMEERCWIDSNLKGENYQIETNPGVTGLNYQRLKNLFCKDVSYEEIDKQLFKKDNYKCISILSTLFFDEAKSIKVGGFLMRPPFDGNIDKYDFMWSVASDIACSIYLQYCNLNNIIASSKDYILGCGGGLQSKFISQMISDLTQKKLYIRSGYSQASLNGGIKICNEYFKINTSDIDKDCTIYYPSKNNLIKKYYSQWYETRININ